MSAPTSAKPAEFDGFAADYDAALNKGISLSGEAKDYFIEGRIKWLGRCLDRLGHKPAGPRVLDFGCGTGGSFPTLRRELGAAGVMGIDVSSAELEIARRDHPWAGVYLPADAPDDLSADIAYSNGTFHHIPPADRGGAVARIFGALRPGGIFALWENNPWNPGTRMVMKRIPFDRDAITLSAPVARRMLRAGGFEILRTDFFFIFPRRLAPLRKLEPALSRLPIGAQYQVLVPAGLSERFIIFPMTADSPTPLPAGAHAAQRALAVSRRTVAPADNRGKRIGILVVAFNAVTTLAAVLRRIPREVWENVEEVVVFDDASHDDTYALAVGYKALSGIEKLTVVRNARNLGYGGNQKLGYRYFLDKQFDAVVLLHGDGQYAPEVLADLYAPLVSGEADAVFGSRMMDDYGGPRKGGMPLYKLLGNRILTAFENRSLGMALTEFHSGYRAYSLAALARIDLSKMTDDFHFDTEIIIKLQHQGLVIREVPIPTFYGEELCYVDGLKYARDVFRAVVRYRRTLSGGRIHPEFAEYARSQPPKGR